MDVNIRNSGKNPDKIVIMQIRRSLLKLILLLFISSLVNSCSPAKQPGLQHYSTLSQAVLDNNYSKVESLLNQGWSPYHKDIKTMTPMTLAIKKGHTKIVQLFLQEERGLYSLSPEGQTWMGLAAKYGQLEMVKTFLNWGVPVDFRDIEGESAILEAARAGHLDIVQLLVNHHANMWVRDINGDSVLREAVRHGHLIIINYCLEKGFTSEHDLFALRAAAESGQIRIFNHLIKKGWKIEPDLLLLRAAIKGQNLSIIRQLLKQGFSPAEDPETVELALKSGNLTLVQILVEAGMNITDSGDHALKWAAESGQLNLIKWLIREGLNLQTEIALPPGGNDNDDNEDRQGIVDWAVSGKHLKLLKWLTEQGLKAKSRFALEHAIDTRNIQIITLILNQQKDIKSRVYFVEQAILTGDWASIELLLKALEIESFQLQALAIFALEQKKRDIFNKLIDFMSPLGLRPEKNQILYQSIPFEMETLVQAGLRGGHLQVLKDIQKKYPRRFKKQLTTFELNQVMESGNLPLLKWLEQYNINLTSSQLEQALAQGWQHISRWLINKKLKLPLKKSLIWQMAIKGRFDLLELYRLQGTKFSAFDFLSCFQCFSPSLYQVAFQYEMTPYLQYFKPLTSDQYLPYLVTHSIINGNHSALETLIKKGNDLNELSRHDLGVISVALKQGDLNKARRLKTMGAVYWDRHLKQVARRTGHLQLMLWLGTQGFKHLQQVKLSDVLYKESSQFSKQAIKVIPEEEIVIKDKKIISPYQSELDLLNQVLFEPTQHFKIKLEPSFPVQLFFSKTNALQKALRNKDYVNVRKLMADDKEQLIIDGPNALRIALQAGQMNLVQRLIELGLNVNQKRKANQQDLLNIAIELRQAHAVELLVKAGAKVSKTHLLAVFKQYENYDLTSINMARLLLSQVKLARKEHQVLEKMVQYFTRFHQGELLVKLIKQGYHINEKDLNYIVKYGTLPLLKRVIPEQLQNKESNSLLTEAVKRGHPGMIDYLMKYKIGLQHTELLETTLEQHSSLLLRTLRQQGAKLNAEAKKRVIQKVATGDEAYKILLNGQ